METRSFCSKVLLFGEYSVIRDSMALAIPYKKFEGRLGYKQEISPTKDPELMALFHYLREIDKNGRLSFEIDLEGFFEDIIKGLIFESTIPKGYGLGSSGALCAALFERYGGEQYKREKDISLLKNYFSELESHFHGASSGLDPLISFLDQAILIKDKKLEITEVPSYPKGVGAFFLLNTGRERRTEPLVHLFLEKCKSQDFSNLCNNVLSPITNSCISSFLSKDTSSLYEFYRELSDFQYRYFNPMIPKTFQELWKKGLKSEEFYLKLCGAGGGGYLLGMTKDFSRAKEILKGYEISSLFEL
ncbi:MAG: mevalonate kinase [Epsilonproteobacteria bacterium]|nr:MAG: mevalonate kinase [Campylobacterota bacterium]RLA65831.1 MAG: mevalonate kinase [Campylobacterota bacterium]